MRRLVVGVVAAAALFLGLQSVGNAVPAPPAPTPGLPAACLGLVPYDHFDNVRTGTSGADTFLIQGKGTWFIDAKGGDDFIGIQAFNGPNCLVGGTGLDIISGSPLRRDICVTGGNVVAEEGGSDWAVSCKKVVSGAP